MHWPRRTARSPSLIKQQQEAKRLLPRRRSRGPTGAAEEAAEAQASTASESSASGPSPGLGNFAPPPTAPGGAGAVQAAESQLGVPYVWGAESPKGSAHPGFDCSGLVAYAWGQVGVDLPHYSGAQMSDSTPVPLSDLEPGDLLFYGPGGSEHVAMYVGPGEMIEAPETGQVGASDRPAARWRLRRRRPSLTSAAPTASFRCRNLAPGQP